jgi:hypothetical protein
MKNDKKDKLHEEQLRKFKYRVGYKVNESPRYRPLVGANEQFDNLPDKVYNVEDGQAVPSSPNFTNEAGEQQDAQKPGGGAPPAEPSNNPDMGMPPTAPADASADAPAGAPPTEEPPTEEPPAGGGTMPPAEPPVGDMGAMPPAEPQQQVDDIQNDIIKHNIAAMQEIDNQLKSLNATVDGLNAKLETLGADVEEVREPSNTEKLMSKTNVSYPYYFNLNDFWSGNWFNEQRNKEHEKGIRELPDGSYIADFDDLPQKSKTDVQNSFNDFN